MIAGSSNIDKLSAMIQSVAPSQRFSHYKNSMLSVTRQSKKVSLIDGSSVMILQERARGGGEVMKGKKFSEIDVGSKVDLGMNFGI
jgi:hypothetical protein